jgi:hypothetical protein
MCRPSSAHANRICESFRDLGDSWAATSVAEGQQEVGYISPTDVAKRRSVYWRGVRAEVVQSSSLGKFAFCFPSPSHLLVVYEQGSRREEETFVEGPPQSARPNWCERDCAAYFETTDDTFRRVTPSSPSRQSLRPRHRCACDGQPARCFRAGD